MLIGDLPFGYDPKKNDIIVFSKDGVHLLKIKYDDFVRNVGITVPTVSYTDLVVVDNKTKIGELKVGENTYDVYTPLNSSGVSTFVSSSDPTDDIGDDGDLYFVKAPDATWRYIKFVITKHKTTNNYTQLTELQFLDSNNNLFNFQGSNAWSNKPHYTATDGPTSMIDGVIRSDSKALWVASPTAQDPIIMIIESRVPIDLSTYSKIRMITGGDAEARDPSSWTLSVSNDQTNWILINEESDYQMTSTRLAVGYEGNLTVPTSAQSQSMIIKRYFKESGHWIPIYN